MNALQRFTCAGGAVAFFSLGISEEADLPSGGSAALADAVASFNAKANESSIGREQKALTEEEVIAAIRWWDFHRQDAPVSDEEYRAFRNIAESHRLPPGAGFEVLTGFEPNDEVSFDAWSVRIRMPKSDGGTYAFLIRETMIRSRLIGPEEREVIRKWSQSPMGSFQRAEYRKEREAGGAGPVA